MANKYNQLAPHMELLLYTQEYYIIHGQVVSNLYVVNKLFITLQAFAWVMSEWGTENTVQL